MHSPVQSFEYILFGANLTYLIECFIEEYFWIKYWRQHQCTSLLLELIAIYFIMCFIFYFLVCSPCYCCLVCITSCLTDFYPRQPRWTSTRKKHILTRWMSLFVLCSICLIKFLHLRQSIASSLFQWSFCTASIQSFYWSTCRSCTLHCNYVISF